jgi:ATP-dependent RNA helicase RhlE
VDDVTHVINFDVPRASEDYVHRIGRTGRMDATGEAITLVSPEESKEFAAIEAVLGKKVPRKTLAGFESSGRGVAAHERDAGDDRGHRGAGARGAHGPHGHRSRRDHEGAVGRTQGGDHGRSAHGGPSPQASSPPAAVTHGRRPRAAAGDRRSRRRM